MYRSRVFTRDGQTYNNPTFTGAGATLGDGTGTTYTFTSNLSGATDPTLAFGNALITTTNTNLHISGTATGVFSGSSPDVSMFRAGVNQWVFGASAAGAGAATTRAQGNKAVASIANNTATTVATITIPNAAHSASVEVRITGSLGAGGAIGANEASATNIYVITVTRTAGVNAVAAISSAYGAAASAVAGAATVTATLTLAAVSGAVGATNTIDIQATIARSGGSSTNHTAVITWSLLNANTTGVTIA